MKVFTEKDLRKIQKLIESSDFESIIQSEKYDDYNVFVVLSKVPMDEWEYEGTYFLREFALLREDGIIKSYGYDNCPINVDIEPRTLSSIKSYSDKGKHIWSLGNTLEYELKIFDK